MGEGVKFGHAWERGVGRAPGWDWRRDGGIDERRKMGEEGEGNREGGGAGERLVRCWMEDGGSVEGGWRGSPELAAAAAAAWGQRCREGGSAA